jgi:hypothetical protein
MRAIPAVGLWAALMLSGAGATHAQTDPVAFRKATYNRLWTLVKPYAESLHFRVYSDDDPYSILLFCDKDLRGKDLRYTTRFEIYITVTREQTIVFRIYPITYINIYDEGNAPDGLMQKLLRLSDEGFFYWAADDEDDIFAGYMFTLESGFPEEAIKVVIRSIPLLDPSLGQLRPFFGN